jgi:hypothetical protein
MATATLAAITAFEMILGRKHVPAKLIDIIILARLKLAHSLSVTETQR